MLKMLDKNAERYALLIFYTMLVITMAVEVLRREVFSYSSIWGEEIVRYSFILVQSLLRDVRDFKAGRPVYEGERLFD